MCERATEAVRALYTLRDHFFETHDTTCAAKREDEVAAKMKETVREIDEIIGGKRFSNRFEFTSF